MRGYRLSKALQDHNSVPKMKQFVSDLAAMSARYELTPDETDAIARGDVDRLNELGANPYLIRFAFRDRFEN